MAFTTPKMSLKVWNSETDSYDHEQLADNFLKLDQHNHGPGQGVQIGASGLAANAVTGDKIAPHSIGATQIIDNSITTTQIQDGSITLIDLAPEILPAGMLLPFGIPVTAGSEPSGWLLCNGQEVPISSFPRLWAAFGSVHLYGSATAGSFKLPDYQGRSFVGVNPGINTLTGASQNDAKAVGSRLQTHTHTDTGHQHGYSFGGDTGDAGSHAHQVRYPFATVYKHNPDGGPRYGLVKPDEANLAGSPVLATTLNNGETKDFHQIDAGGGFTYESTMANGLDFPITNNPTTSPGFHSEYWNVHSDAVGDHHHSFGASGFVGNAVANISGTSINFQTAFICIKT